LLEITPNVIKIWIIHFFLILKKILQNKIRESLTFHLFTNLFAKNRQYGLANFEHQRKGDVPPDDTPHRQVVFFSSELELRTAVVKQGFPSDHQKVLVPA
jgi:hypothetical protein